MRKARKIVLSVITWIIIVIAVCMTIFTVVSVLTFDQVDRNLFGYKAFIVLSDSMSATDFSAGDLVLTNEVDPSTLQPGDIIAFQSTNSENYGAIVTHKIRQLTTTEDGQPGFITYGTTTDQDDETIVTYDKVVGKYQFSLPKVGTFFQFLRTPAGYVICILVPFLLLIGIQGFNSVRLFRKYRREQMAEMRAERDHQLAQLTREREQLARERAESERLLRQLQQMQQAQMRQNQQPGGAVSAPPRKDETQGYK